MPDESLELTVPASVWGLPEMRHALAQRDIATVLLLVHKHHVPTVTQSRLALELGLEPSTLNLIVNRRRGVTALAMLERIAEGLRMPDPARMVLGLAPVDIVETVAATGDARDSRSLGMGRVKEATVMAAAESESSEFIQRSEVSNVGAKTIEQLYAGVHDVVHRYPSRPVTPSFLDAWRLRREVFALLKGQQPLRYRRDLSVFAATLSGVLANAAFDLGHFTVAETHARSALAAADDAGHNGLHAWVRGTQALIAYWDRRYPDAAQAAADGWRVSGPESGTARVRAAAIEARARARMGDSRGADDALHRAEQARDAITDFDEIGGMMGFPVAKQRFYSGAARLLLDGQYNLVEAEYLSSEAVSLYMQDPSSHRRVGEMSLAQLDLAEIRLLQHELEAAAEHIGDVLTVGAERRTEAVSRRLFELRAALDGPTYRGVPSAISLRDRIADASMHALPMLPAREDEK
ncbi:hypothetical protein ACFWPH_27985 [Nocardia sp. NPDC058499]|uniref:hypothetical protein n=1 Tax=Nocardia sp. NPDC058499 TaxID=3346530 RepID=UPI00365CFF83